MTIDDAISKKVGDIGSELLGDTLHAHGWLCLCAPRASPVRHHWWPLGNGLTVTSAYVQAGALTDITGGAFTRHLRRDVPGNIVALGDGSGVPVADGAKSNPNAVAEMLVLAEEFPNAPELWVDLAYIYSIQKDRASAADAVSRAIALDPDEPVYLFDRARYRASLGDYHGVIEDASRGIELSERIEFFTYKELLIFLRAYACVELREFCAAKDDLMSMERQDAVMWIHTLVTWEDLMARCDAGTSSETSSNG